MASKPSGLGRGFGDLLEDNTPSLRTRESNVVVRGGEGNLNKTSQSALPNRLLEVKTRPLFESKPRNKSVK